MPRRKRGGGRGGGECGGASSPNDSSHAATPTTPSGDSKAPSDIDDTTQALQKTTIAPISSPSEEFRRVYSDIKNAAAKRAADGPDFTKPQDIVSILVGLDEEKQEFKVHKDILCNSSPYFERLFYGPFSEAKSGSVTINHTTAEAFGLLVHWVYTGKIKQTKCNDDSLTELERERAEKPSARDLANLWIFADYTQMPALQNQAIDRYLERMIRTHSFEINIMSMAYRDTKEASPLRRIMVDYYVWAGIPPWMSEYPQHFTKEVLVDVATACMRRSREPFMANPLHDASNYHVEDGSRCQERVVD